MHVELKAGTRVFGTEDAAKYDQIVIAHDTNEDGCSEDGSGAFYGRDRYSQWYALQAWQTYGAVGEEIGHILFEDPHGDDPLSLGRLEILGTDGVGMVMSQPERTETNGGFAVYTLKPHAAAKLTSINVVPLPPDVRQLALVALSKDLKQILAVVRSRFYHSADRCRVYVGDVTGGNPLELVDIEAVRSDSPAPDITTWDDVQFHHLHGARYDYTELPDNKLALSRK